MSKYITFWSDAYQAHNEAQGLAVEQLRPAKALAPLATKQEIARFRTGINAPFPVVELETANAVIDEAIAADYYRQLAHEMAGHLAQAGKVVAGNIAVIERLAAACLWFSFGRPEMAALAFDEADEMRVAGV